MKIHSKPTQNRFLTAQELFFSIIYELFEAPRLVHHAALESGPLLEAHGAVEHRVVGEDAAQRQGGARRLLQDGRALLRLGFEETQIDSCEM